MYERGGPTAAIEPRSGEISPKRGEPHRGDPFMSILFHSGHGYLDKEDIGLPRMTVPCYPITLIEFNASYVYSNYRDELKFKALLFKNRKYFIFIEYNIGIFCTVLL